MKRAIFSATITVSLLLPVLIYPGRANADDPAVQAEGVVDGIKADLTDGSVVYQAQPTADGCSVPERVGIGAVVQDSANVDSVSISTRFDDACRLVVTDIQTSASTQDTGLPVEVETSSLPPETPPAAPGITIPVEGTQAVDALDIPDTHAYKVQLYKGWTKSRMEEYVNIDTTQSYMEFQYFHYRDNTFTGYRVDRPHKEHGWCWMDSKWIWINDKCEYKSYDQSPAQVWYEDWAHFHSSTPPRPDYTHYSTYFAEPTFFNFDCYLSQGVQPAGWGFNCEGGRKLMATFYP